ncbi:MAG: aminopeptidase P family protein [Spirochaetales bacterium]|jgi:Xaa-Pro dipeptidase|nr:aminopeptidase P family protein [Spirochaetales bacterium]
MSKLALIQEYLKAEKIDGWLLYAFRDQNPIALSVSGLPSAGSRRWFLWIPSAGRPVWIAHRIEKSNFIDLPADLQGDVKLYVSWQEIEALLKSTLRVGEKPAEYILMEYSPENAIPYVSRVDAGIMELVKRNAGVEIASSADMVQIAVATINPEHLAGQKRAADLCLEVKDAAFAWIGEQLRSDTPVTEYDAQQQVAKLFSEAGMDPLSSIVAVNANAADPHYFPSEKLHSRIKKGDVVLIDLWNREKGDPEACFADLTWTAYCGEVTPPRVAEIFNIVSRARDRAVEFIQERISEGRDVYGYEADDACREVIENAGYGEAFFHRTGHSLGPTGHYIGVNIDNLETQDRRKILPGVMFSIEPGIYVPDFDFDDSQPAKGLGIRSEIDCYVHADRIEVTTLPLQTAVAPLLAD